MSIRIVALGTGPLSRGKTIALAIAAVVVGGIFLALGLALLASVALIGTLVATGLAIARLVRGRASLPPRERPLDPSLEVFPDTDDARRLDSTTEAR